MSLFYSQNRISWVTFSVGVHPTNQSKYNRYFEFSRNEPDIILVTGLGPKVYSLFLIKLFFIKLRLSYKPLPIMYTNKVSHKLTL